MHDEMGKLTFQPYGKEGQAIYSVSRGGLNLELMKIADTFPDVNLHFNEACEGVDPREGILRFKNTESEREQEVKAPLIFGADGAFSAVRYSLQKTPRFNYSQQYLDYGYKELTIPPNADGSHAIEPHALHIWPRGKFMLIALPNVDGSFTCTLFLPFDDEADSFEHLQTDKEVLEFFQQYFADAIPLIPELLKEFRENPTAGLVTVRCDPWQFDERILLIGDASHAIVPFYGQGMNAGFEDCSILYDLMEAHEEDWSAIIRTFNDTRIKDGNAIADLALRNFIEMRDWVADPQFILRKKIAGYLHEQYPEKFLPVYSMVSFSNIPYSEALAEVHAQDALFERILAIENIAEKWNGPEVEQVFREWLAEREARLV